MALFDLSAAMSIEAPAMFYLAERISESAAWQDLCETPGDATAARAKLTLGPQGDPWTDDRKTREELEAIFVDGMLAPGDEDPLTLIAPETNTECPLEGGTFDLYIRRQVRAVELSPVDGIRDIYQFFLDRVSAIPRQVHRLAKLANPERPILRGSRRSRGPLYGDNQERSTQGDYLWALIQFDWGDLED